MSLARGSMGVDGIDPRKLHIDQGVSGSGVDGVDVSAPIVGGASDQHFAPQQARHFLSYIKHHNLYKLCELVIDI
jgi:hypothetical protein